MTIAELYTSLPEKSTLAKEANVLLSHVARIDALAKDFASGRRSVPQESILTSYDQAIKRAQKGSDVDLLIKLTADLESSVELLAKIRKDLGRASSLKYCSDELNREIKTFEDQTLKSARIENLGKIEISAGELCNQATRNDNSYRQRLEELEEQRRLEEKRAEQLAAEKEAARLRQIEEERILELKRKRLEEERLEQERIVEERRLIAIQETERKAAAEAAAKRKQIVKYISITVAVLLILFVLFRFIIPFVVEHWFITLLLLGGIGYGIYKAAND